jgi:hypothetical protein
MAKTTDFGSPQWDAVHKAVELGLLPEDVTPDEHVKRGRQMFELRQFILKAAREENAEPPPFGLDIDAPTLAIMFHNNYERLAPSHGYEIRQETRRFDPDSPNGKLMVATCVAVLAELAKR